MSGRICSQCDSHFDSRNKLDSHRKRVHQRSGKITFGHGTIHLQDNTTQHVSFDDDTPMKCPRCLDIFKTFQSLQNHTRLNCKRKTVNSHKLPPTRLNQRRKPVKITASPNVQRSPINIKPSLSPLIVRNIDIPVVEKIETQDSIDNDSNEYFGFKDSKAKIKDGQDIQHEEFDFGLVIPRNRISMARIEFEKSLLQD